MDLGAIDDHGTITSLGRRMLAFPVHPRYARMLLAAQDYGCVRRCADRRADPRPALLTRRQGNKSVTRGTIFSAAEPASDLFVLIAPGVTPTAMVRIDRGRRIGIHAQTARQVGPLFDSSCGLPQTRVWTPVKSRSYRMPCSVACWLAFPTILPSVRTAVRCAVNWSMAGAVCWSVRAL